MINLESELINSVSLSKFITPFDPFIFMPSKDAFIFGLFVGMLSSGFYFYYMIKHLKKKGYIVFEPTQKFKDELNKDDIENKNKVD